MDYKIGDIVEIKDTLAGLKLVRLFEIVTIENSIYEDVIGMKRYKGESIQSGDSGLMAFEFLECQIKGVYRKVDMSI